MDNFLRRTLPLVYKKISSFEKNRFRFVGGQGYSSQIRNRIHPGFCSCCAFERCRFEKVPSNFLELPVIYQYRQISGRVKRFRKTLRLNFSILQYPLFGLRQCKTSSKTREKIIPGYRP